MSRKRSKQTQPELGEEQPPQRQLPVTVAGISVSQARAIIAECQKDSLTAITAAVQSTVAAALSKVEKPETVKELPETLLNTVQGIAMPWL